MKMKYYILAFIVFSVFKPYETSAQLKIDNQIQMDSIQRVSMKDSMQIDDIMVTKIFALRDNYFQQVNEIRTSNKLSPVEQDSEVQKIGKQTNENIKNLLGPVIYEKYIRIIRNRMIKKNISGTPLASEGSD